MKIAIERESALRVKEVLGEVEMGLNQARTALDEAKEELADILDRLERVEAVNSHHSRVIEDRALSEMREKEHDAHPGG